MTGLALHQAQGAAVRKGEDRLAAIVAGDAAEAIGDLGQGLIPGDSRELSIAFLADTTQGMEHAERGIDPFGIPVDLVAEKALSEGMLGVAVAG
ncbi:MAG: hypothetical protein H6Q85_2810, partial [candidate division NC10 bacterium]|nr:hypothetical protein [candidate division NC10 bacterium]